MSAARFAIAIMIASVGASASARREVQSSDEIARSILIGQSNANGDVIVGGFVEDADRAWPQQIAVVRLRGGGSGTRNARFVRALTPDDVVPSASNADGENLFETMDGMSVDDRPLSLFKAASAVGNTPVFGWDDAMPLMNISHDKRDRQRPISAAERREIAEEKNRIPKDVECTTVPQYLDSAKIILTATIAKSRVTVRLSQYQTPGCLGHLATIYVLDVIEPGGASHRYQFSHYQGVL
jgi:hypothetical protein